jgi:uncharacterized membrane protein
MNILIELLLSTLMAAAGQVSWRMGMKSIGPIEGYDLSTLFRTFTNWQVDLGLILYGLSTIFWLSALSKKDLSYVYPFVAATYVLVLALSYLFLNEHFGITRLIGAGIVVLGLVVIMRG